MYAREVRMLCCFVCGDSRESMDPSDQYPDMGTWASGDRVWKCDQCAPLSLRECIRQELGKATKGQV